MIENLIEIGLENSGSNIFNCDESAFLANHGSKKVVCSRTKRLI